MDPIPMVCTVYVWLRFWPSRVFLSLPIPKNVGWWRVGGFRKYGHKCIIAEQNSYRLQDTKV